MKIDVVIEDIEVQRKLHELKNNLYAPKALNEIGLFGATRIKARSAKGVDYLNKPFVRYSEAWAKVRDKKGLPTGKVDLTFRGHMFAALTHTAKKDVVIIHFSDAQQAKKAHGHNFGLKAGTQTGRGKTIRRFMGLNQKDQKKITGIISRHING